MFEERLEDWSMTKEVLDLLISRTKEWTGAEVEEIVNSLNLKQIRSKRKKKKVDKEWVEDILKTMSDYGVGEASSNFGFNKKS